MTYTTGISGTQGTINADGTANDTQNIVVNTNSATLNINGAGGVDKFNIEASSFTKSLTIAGNLGTVPDHQEAVNNYDTVRIDLSKTSGVNLDISKLLVSNPNDDGIQITASKGADTINLVAGANHDIIEFSAGGGTTGQAEKYELDLGNLRLGQGQSVTIDGLTITNISGFDNGGIATAVYSAAVVLTAEDIATILAGYLADAGLSVSGAFGGASSTAASKFVSVTGAMESLAKDGWTNASGAITASASGTKITITNSTQQNVTDIDLTANISGNGRTNGIGDKANTAPTFTAGASAASAAVSGSITFVDCTAGSTAAETFDVGISIDGTQHTLTFTVDSSKSVTAGTISTLVQTLISAGTFTADANVTALKVDGAAYDNTKADDYKALFALPDGFSFSGGNTLKVDDTTTTASTTVVFSQTLTAGASGTTPTDATVKGTPATPAVQGELTLDFGSGLLAGQSYSFLGKTVLATADLTGEEVAEAFAFGIEGNSGIDGAVVVGKWGQNYTAGGSVNTSTGSAGIDISKLLFDISGSSLILQELTPGVSDGLVKLTELQTAGKLTLTGTGTLAVRTDKITGETTAQGQGAGEAVFADSYVTFAVVAGSAASGSSAGVATKITMSTSALDTITNFDVSTDKLLLRKFDATGAEGARFTNSDAFSGSGTDVIFVDAEGNTLDVGVANGIISFTTASTAELTLEQKLYAASSVFNAEQGAIGGFAHGGDFYVIATGSGAGTTDDLVIKLAGVSGITDIGAVLG